MHPCRPASCPVCVRGACLTPAFDAQSTLRHKRDGQTLSAAEISAFVRGVVDRSVSEAQASAFLMACFLRGLDPPELAALTEAMRRSGETFDARGLNSYTIDKHSTGGVGDKTSILLGPMLAAAGRRFPNAEGRPGISVPMISGRGLGHTGGTLDKLETIPGFDTQLPLARFGDILARCGACLIGQTPTLVPADRVLYALRDHTATVESPYLITASIMSKKLAEDLQGLVLDVKTGSGAFMQRLEDAQLLAGLMVETGERAGTRTVALITQHNQPIGRYAGNWLEVKECLDILGGRRHPLSADLLELTNALAGWMLFLAGHATTPEAGALLADDLLRSGDAEQAFRAIVQAQGGDLRVIDQPGIVHRPGATAVLLAEADGYLGSIDTRETGWAVQRLGAGRTRPGEPVDAHAGIEVHAKLGDRVTIGQPLVTLYAASASLLAGPLAQLRAAYRIEDSQPLLPPQVQQVVTKS